MAALRLNQLHNSGNLVGFGTGANHAGGLPEDNKHTFGGSEADAKASGGLYPSTVGPGAKDPRGHLKGVEKVPGPPRAEDPSHENTGGSGVPVGWIGTKGSTIGRRLRVERGKTPSIPIIVWYF